MYWSGSAPTPSESLTLVTSFGAATDPLFVTAGSPADGVVGVELPLSLVTGEEEEDVVGGDDIDVVSPLGGAETDKGMELGGVVAELETPKDDDNGMGDTVTLEISGEGRAEDKGDVGALPELTDDSVGWGPVDGSKGADGAPGDPEQPESASEGTAWPADVPAGI